MKTCTHCKIEKPLEDFPPHKQTRDRRGSWCRECTRPMVRANNRRIKNLDPVAARHRSFNKKAAKTHGVTWQEKTELIIEQGGACAICTIPLITSRAVVDHNHETGEMRGVLCSPCNFLLGFAYDDVSTLKAAIAYLMAHP